jgi:hypothetical protein
VRILAEKQYLIIIKKRNWPWKKSPGVEKQNKEKTTK